MNCPKENPLHRMLWKEDYNQDFMAHLSEFNKLAISNNIEAILAYPLAMILTSKGIIRLLKKYRKFIDLGIHSFCLLFDDLFEISQDPYDAEIVSRELDFLGMAKLREH